MNTRRNWLVVVAVLVLSVLTFGQTPCPVQKYLSWDDLSVAVDPNQIAVHPITGKPLFLGGLSVEVGRQWAYEGYACDPDGDAMAITADSGVLDISNYVYTLLRTESSVGVKYINISATDVPTPPAAPITVTGTLVVIAIPRNQPPVLCGGRP